MSLLQRVEHLLILALCDASSSAPRPVYSALSEAFPCAVGWRGLERDSRIARRAHLLCTRELLPKPPLPTASVLSTLREEGVRWQAYHHGVATPRLFEVHASTQLAHVDALMDALRGDGAALPAVSWIDPDFTRPGWAGSDDHPAGSPARAEALLAQIYDGLREGPRWERSLLWVLWDKPDPSRPPLLITPWLEAGLQPGLTAASVARSALHRFARRPFMSLIPGEADEALSVFELPSLTAPRRDTPKRLSAITLPEKDPGPVLDDPWQAWLAQERASRAPSAADRLDAFGRRVAGAAERRGEEAERRLVDASERLSEAGERWLSRLDKWGDS